MVTRVLLFHISSVLKKVQKYTIAKKKSLGYISRECNMISWVRVLKFKIFQTQQTLEVVNMRSLNLFQASVPLNGLK